MFFLLHNPVHGKQYLKLAYNQSAYFNCWKCGLKIMDNFQHEATVSCKAIGASL